ncbi:MAG: DUF971 domain-containing protein [Polyangiaceae bacterium]|nr:DUF971 domain-containing protein [Polyangiaceae bacterium]
MADSATFRPKAVHAPHGAAVLSVTWADGHKSSYPHRILRGFCPCAGCQGHGGEIRFIEGGSLELRELEQIGNYALGLTWGDSHTGGIYSFRYLRRLGDLLDEHGAGGVEQLGALPRT